MDSSTIDWFFRMCIPQAEGLIQFLLVGSVRRAVFQVKDAVILNY